MGCNYYCKPRVCRYWFSNLAASDGIVIAASKWGKIKTVSQMIMVILLLWNGQGFLFQWLETIFIGASVIFYYYFIGIDYIMKNKQVLAE